MPVTRRKLQFVADQPPLIPLIASLQLSRMLTIEEVARLLNVSIRTVHTIKKNRQLKFYRVRGQLRFDLADVNEYLQQRAVKPAA